MSYAWDNNGNLLNDGVNSYNYDAANRLSTATVGGTGYTYAYSGAGDRLNQTSGGTTTQYVLDLNAGLTQVLGDGTNGYLYGNGRIAQYNGLAPEYFLGDALGSVRQLADGNGAVTLTKAYQPFGKVLSSSGSGASIYGFDSEQMDGTGLQYLRARYYEPNTGRFLSRDLWNGASKTPMSYNAWIFGLVNPTRFIDRSGHIPVDCSADDPFCPARECTDYDWACLSYHSDYFKNYNPHIKPSYVSFIGNELKGKSDQFTYNLVCYDPVSKSTHCGGLCGEGSLGAIFGLNVTQMIDIWKTVFPNTNPNNTDLPQLKSLVEEAAKIVGKNADYKDLKLVHTYDKNSQWDKWGSILKEYLSTGYSLIGGITVNGETGLLQNNDKNSKFYKDSNQIQKYDFVAHWIVITGISSTNSWDFGDDRSGRNKTSFTKWLRIYNPMHNDTEYYWWGDLMPTSINRGDENTVRNVTLAPDYLAIRIY